MTRKRSPQAVLMLLLKSFEARLDALEQHTNLMPKRAKGRRLKALTVDLSGLLPSRPTQLDREIT